MIDSNGEYLPEHYVAEHFGVPASTLVGAPIVNTVIGYDGSIRLNVCVDYPGLTDEVKLLRKLKNKISDMECFDSRTGERQRFFVFSPIGDAFWLRFGQADRIIRA